MAEFVFSVIWVQRVEIDLHVGSVREVRADNTAGMVEQHHIASGLAGLR